MIARSTSSNSRQPISRSIGISAKGTVVGRYIDRRFAPRSPPSCERVQVPDPVRYPPFPMQARLTCTLDVPAVMKNTPYSDVSEPFICAKHVLLPDATTPTRRRHTYCTETDDQSLAFPASAIPVAHRNK